MTVQIGGLFIDSSATWRWVRPQVIDSVSPLLKHLGFLHQSGRWSGIRTHHSTSTTFNRPPTQCKPVGKVEAIHGLAWNYHLRSSNKRFHYGHHIWRYSL